MAASGVLEIELIDEAHWYLQVVLYKYEDDRKTATSSTTGMIVGQYLNAQKRLET